MLRDRQIADIQYRIENQAEELRRLRDRIRDQEEKIKLLLDQLNLTAEHLPACTVLVAKKSGA